MPNATGYTQNPSGASISEEMQPLLVLLDRQGAPLQRFDMADRSRQDQLRTVTSLNGRWLIGGMRNGPGTHSGDTQPALITADGQQLFNAVTAMEQGAGRGWQWIATALANALTWSVGDTAGWITTQVRRRVEIRSAGLILY